MAKTRTEKIEDIKTEIAQLQQRQKELTAAQREQERKDRTRRLCKRMGLIESLLPDTIALTEEQFKAFVEKTVANDYGRNTLARITAQTNATTITKPVETAQPSGTGEGANRGNGAQQGAAQNH